MTKHPKIKTRRVLISILRIARRQGKQIVFTNGCFDLLHIGHIRYLQKARSLGDLLVVGVNGDGSVRRQKGSNRPIVPEMERAEVLASLACVNYVVLFGEETPLRLIETLGPDILVKGEDWAPDEIVGRDTVKKNGGRVARIRLVPGASTTQIVRRILRRYHT